jgi:hypothetical protein
MKIRLEDAVRTVHTAKRRCVQDLITAAGVMPGSRAFLYECAFVFCQVENFFAAPDRVFCGMNVLIHSG